MSSASFHTILFTISPYVAFSASVLSVVAIVYALLLSRRLDHMLIGKDGSLEETLAGLTAHMKDTKLFRKELEQYLKHTEVRLRSTVRGVGVVRYNPFHHDGSSGGNQSFTIALLDETLSGVVFSALYSRDRVGVYAKPMVSGKSTFTLSEEEQEAVAQARDSISHTRVEQK